MVKRKQKKVVKQKQKQNVNVKQNVKVVVGEIKKKRAVKSSGAKSGAGAKPPIILNISQPQPYNNPYMEYFRNQLQNQQPEQGNTLLQQEKINEKEENKASRAGALHKLDQEPNDVAREMRKQRIAGIERFQQAQAERKSEEREMSSSIIKIRKPKTPKRKHRLVLESSSQSESNILSEIEQQTNTLEQVMEKREDIVDTGASADIESDIPQTPLTKYKSPKNAITEKLKTIKRRGRKPISQEQMDARIQEEARLRRERLQMIAEDKPRRGRKMLSQEEIDKRKRQREISKHFEGMFKSGYTSEE